jgi:hypothetical protein
MSKWISEFLPSKSGSYLVRKSAHTTSKFYYTRYEFDINNLGWWKHGFLQFDETAIDNSYITFEWWDEYGITENKTVKKLNFKSNGKV